MGAKQEVQARGRKVASRVTIVAPLWAIVCVLAWAGCSSPRAIPEAPERDELPAVRGGDDRIGLVAPPFEVEGWIGEHPGDITDLRGRVVLVRFWTDTCPYCRASAPALVELDRDFAARGLVVLAIHHPKPRGRSTDRDEIARIVDAWGFRFPVGLDESWRTIDTWWLASGDRAATSATFLVDRRGVIRWVHPGPEYHPGGPADHARCRSDYADLRRAIQLLLAEA